MIAAEATVAEENILTFVAVARAPDIVRRVDSVAFKDVFAIVNTFSRGVVDSFPKSQ